MSQYRNQARRVIDFIIEDTKLPEKALSETLNIDIDFIEKRIASLVKQKLANGKEAADLIMDQWKRADPSYLKKTYSIVHAYKGLEYRFKVLKDEFHIYLEPQTGAWLHSIKGVFEDTQEFKDKACEETWKAYQEKIKTMKL
jgi:hypothetical protein